MLSHASAAREGYAALDDPQPGDRLPVTPIPLRSVPAAPRTALQPPPVVARSAAMRSVIQRARLLGPAGLATLVCGPTGTGKELITSLLHAWSPRAAGPLVRFNCGAIPRDLVESELFGHQRGAFTGAVSSRKGYFGAAAGGTLVLDEVEALALEAQPKLLRALEEGEVQVVGAGKPQFIDVRIIACTNVDLAAEVSAGRFRRDLYYRLAVVQISIPALRDRPEDVLPLFAHFLSNSLARLGRPAVCVADDLADAMVGHAWPGNVRELKNAVAAMVALTEDGVLDRALFDSVVRPMDRPDTSAAPHYDASKCAFKSRVAAFEKGLVERALLECGLNCSKTARQLGLSRTTLHDLIRRHGIEMHSLRSRTAPPSHELNSGK